MKAGSTVKTAKVVGIDSYRQFEVNRANSVEIAQLSLKLQQTLELVPLLHTFCSQSQQLIPCDFVQFSQHNSDFLFQTGTYYKHQCQYQLDIENDNLGEFIFARKKPFTIAETHEIEKLLALIIYPLRNALLYKKAVVNAYRDPLTTLNNRAAFEDTMTRVTCNFRRHDTDFSILMLDIDHFKKINDTYGHLVGDTVLKEFSQCLKNSVRLSDEVFRYGGEEFVIVLKNTHHAGARLIAERIREQLKSLILKDGKQVTTSIGISSSHNNPAIEKILVQADQALYQAKNNGRNSVVTHWNKKEAKHTSSH